jgi:Holliday junction resolvase RusA-like endonuclease
MKNPGKCQTTDMSAITFFVAGIAKPAGSKRGFYIPKLNRVVITDANKNSKDWKTDVKHGAQRAYAGPLLECPLDVSFEFFVSRPKCHFGSGKNASNLKASAPNWPKSKPDLLKLARGVEDAMSGIIYKDDAQIVVENLYKSFTDEGRKPGVRITITPLK